MKRILFIIISILSISIKAQVGFIYIKYSSSDGVSHKFPILKIDGEKCIKNKNETKPNWDEYYPFFVNVNGELFDADQVLEEALKTARVIASNAPLSIKQVKKSIRYGSQMELKTAFRFEVESYNHLIDTADRIEGVEAFNEKRPAQFKGS